MNIWCCLGVARKWLNAFFLSPSSSCFLAVICHKISYPLPGLKPWLYFWTPSEFDALVTFKHYLLKSDCSVWAYVQKCQTELKSKYYIRTYPFNIILIIWHLMLQTLMNANHLGLFDLTGKVPTSAATAAATSAAVTSRDAEILRLKDELVNFLTKYSVIIQKWRYSRFCDDNTINK